MTWTLYLKKEKLLSYDQLLSSFWFSEHSTRAQAWAHHESQFSVGLSGPAQTVFPPVSLLKLVGRDRVTVSYPAKPSFFRSWTVDKNRDSKKYLRWMSSNQKLVSRVALLVAVVPPWPCGPAKLTCFLAMCVLCRVLQALFKIWPYSLRHCSPLPKHIPSGTWSSGQQFRTWLEVGGLNPLTQYCEKGLTIAREPPVLLFMLLFDHGCRLRSVLFHIFVACRCKLCINQLAHVNMNKDFGQYLKPSFGRGSVLSFCFCFQESLRPYSIENERNPERAKKKRQQGLHCDFWYCFLFPRRSAWLSSVLFKYAGLEDARLLRSEIKLSISRRVL